MIRTAGWSRLIVADRITGLIASAAFCQADGVKVVLVRGQVTNTQFGQVEHLTPYCRRRRQWRCRQRAHMSVTRCSSVSWKVIDCASTSALVRDADLPNASACERSNFMDPEAPPKLNLETSTRPTLEMRTWPPTREISQSHVDEFGEFDDNHARPVVNIDF